MRRFVSGILAVTLLASVSLLAQDAKPATTAAKKTTAKKTTTKAAVKATPVEEKLDKVQQALQAQQSEIQQQQTQIQQLQQQLQQSSAVIQQQNAQLQNSVQQASQQAAAAQQAASNLSVSVADLKAGDATITESLKSDEKKADKILNPDAYAPKPTIVSAVAPVRVLPLDPPKKDGLIPTFRLGVVRVTPYGFIKSTVAEDSSSPRGDDFPLPGFLNGDTGPNENPEFHLKARASRFGTNIEWPDASKNLTITGKFEFDWEGVFSRADNRNVSSIRSNAPTIRLGFVRMDYTAGKTDLFFEAGQDWTPFGSSTLPNLLESTGNGIAFGMLYERQPEMRFGFVQSLGTKYNFKLSPEIAIVQPGFGNLPTDLGNQLGYGERQGSDADRPEVEGRVVLQWQLDPAKGVAPAQLIVSGVQGRREAIVLASAVPAADLSAFPDGATVSSDRWGVSVEGQLPTRWFTLVGKAYRGADLRYFFAGELFSNYNDTAGLTGISKVASVDGSSTVVFGTNAAGQVVVAPQRPVRANGGFLNLGLPLSKWFNANPAGRNAGWQLYFTYGLDQAESRDLYHMIGDDAASRARNRLGAATLYYKLNQWCTFAYEQSLYTTVAVPNATTGAYFKVSGVESREWNDRREEFGPIFTF
ncbi:MAG TPA: hypothetical protein VGL89_01155 [Candidatus Koribacter sp.]|jgi:hypothetical protein